MKEMALADALPKVYRSFPKSRPKNSFEQYLRPTPMAHDMNLPIVHLSFTSPQHSSSILNFVNMQQGRRNLICPTCSAGAVQKYGRIASGKQRFLCVGCGRQFTLRKTRQEVKTKPDCPKCNTRMHLYKQDAQVLRFRCSRYPRCKTYMKTARPKEDKRE